MKRILATGALIVGSVMSLNAMAQQAPSAEDLIKRRQSVFQLLSFANGPMGGMARGGEFDKDAAIQGYQRMSMLADMIPGLFADDTSGSGAATRALDSIWGNPDDFASKAGDLKSAAEAAIAALEGGETEMRGLVGSVGRTCGGCHDAYRAD